MLASCAGPRGFEVFGRQRLYAPPMMWSEATSVLHEAVWRSELRPDDAAKTLARLEEAPIRPHSPAGLRRDAWKIADELGWAKTYDAEYLALAALLGCRLVTLDLRLRRGADRLGYVVVPSEL